MNVVLFGMGWLLYLGLTIWLITRPGRYPHRSRRVRTRGFQTGAKGGELMDMGGVSRSKYRVAHYADCGHWIDELTLSRYLDMGPSFRCPNCNHEIVMEDEG